MAWVQVPGYQQGEGDWVPGYWVDHATGQISYADPNAAAAPNLYGWDANNPNPAGGRTVGWALAPNYLSQGYQFADDADLRRAISSVLPGYQQPDVIDLNAPVSDSMFRAPAKDTGLERFFAPAAMAALGALSGGFGLGDMYSQFASGAPEVAVSSGTTPGTGVAGWDSALAGGDDAIFSMTGTGADLPVRSNFLDMPASGGDDAIFSMTGTGQDLPVGKDFMGGSGGLPRAPTPTPSDKKSDLGLKAATAAAGLLSQGGAVGDSGAGLADSLREQEAQRQANLDAARAGIDSAFAGFDDNYYSGIAKAYRDFQMPLFQEQVTRARRALPASVANTQSSAFLRKQGELETDIGRQEAQIGNDAITQANAARGNVEQNRADLLNLASAGTDAATLADQAAAKALSLSAPAQFVPLADLFSKYATDAAQASALARPVQTNAPSRPLLFNTGAGSRAVRTIR